jgi:hypothetical protein
METDAKKIAGEGKWGYIGSQKKQNGNCGEIRQLSSSCDSVIAVSPLH